MENVDLEDHDFQAPIVSLTNESPRKRAVEEEEEEEEDNPEEHLNCTLCEKAWTTQGSHRIVHLKCGDVFGKSCIDSYVKTFSSCPMCGNKADKKEARVIWPTKVIHEDEVEMKRLKDALETSKNELKTYLEETLFVQRQLKECRNELSLAKAMEEIILKPPPSAEELVDVTAQPKEFKLYQKFVSSTEKYRTAEVLPLFEMIVVSAEQSRNNTHGIRKINMFDSSTTEYIGLHLGQIKDLKTSSEKCMALSTGLDKTLKLTSLTNNVTVQTYTLGIAGWSCAFDENDSNLLYCGLANNTLMVYDIRNTKDHLHKLKDSSSQISAPIHSLNVAKADNTHSSVLCSNLVNSYEWEFGENEPRYTPIETTQGFKPFHSYYRDGKLLSSLRNKDITEYVMSSKSGTSAYCSDWSYTNNKKQMSLARNCFFERNNDTFICFSEGDQIKCRNREMEIQNIKANGSVLDIKHCNVDDDEILIALCENEVCIYKYM